MAYIDYQHCAKCDVKCFYDAGIDWGHQRAKEVASLCYKCADLYTIAVVERRYQPDPVNEYLPWVNPSPYRDSPAWSNWRCCISHHRLIQE
jgi:hypothetical protein